MTGAATGAGLAAAATRLLGQGSVGTAAVLGGLCGAYSTLRGNQKSRFRDAGAFGLTFGSPLLTGGAKAGLGLASVIGAEVDKEGGRALLAGSLGAAAGVAFSMTGYAGLSPLTAGLAGAGVAALGAVGGPRLGMAMRNATEDLGQVMTRPRRAPKAEKSMVSRTVGVLHMAVFRQGAMAALMGRLDPVSVATGIGLDATLSAYEVYLKSRHQAKPGA